MSDENLTLFIDQVNLLLDKIKIISINTKRLEDCISNLLVQIPVEEYNNIQALIRFGNNHIIMYQHTLQFNETNSDLKLPDHKIGRAHV